MRDIYELLRQKELQISRLEIEVEALRVVAPLLSEDKEVGNDNKATSARSTARSHPGFTGRECQSTTHPR
jgi:hypothetical protein